MEQISLNEFEKLYMKPSKNWKFDLFKIMCSKCDSTKVEFNSTLEVGYGYYNDFIRDGEIVVKCHDCGNAFTMGHYDLEPK